MTDPAKLAQIDQEIANNNTILDNIVDRVRDRLDTDTPEQVLADLTVTLPAVYDHGDLGALAAAAILRVARDGAA